MQPRANFRRLSFILPGGLTLRTRRVCVRSCVVLRTRSFSHGNPALARWADEFRPERGWNRMMHATSSPENSVLRVFVRPADEFILRVLCTRGESNGCKSSFFLGVAAVYFSVSAVRGKIDC